MHLPKTTPLLASVCAAGVALAGDKPASTNSAALAATNAAAAEAASPAGAAIRKAVEYLTNITTNDFEGWFAPPDRQSAPIGWKEKTVSYKKVTIDVPDYETRKVETWVTRRAGQSADSAPIREKVVTRERTGKKIGSHKEERIVEDPKGDIQKTVKIPIMGPGGPDVWPYGRFGHNAMAIHALVRSGVDPQDSVVRKPAGLLKDLFTVFGLPDGTWDLAWLTAAFSDMGGGFTNIASRAAARLLDGQLVSGPGAGLWGPVCVNTRLVAAMMECKQDLDEDYLKLTGGKRPARAGDGAKRENDPEAAIARIRKFTAGYKDVSMLCFRTDYHRLQGRVGLSRPESPELCELVVAGLTHYVFNQAAADMESTAVALYGLRVAREKGLVPQTVTRTADLKAKPFLPPEQAGAVAARASAALARFQAKSGAWTELNIHGPVTDFNSIKSIPGVPLKAAARFPSLGCPTNFCSTAQGLSAGQPGDPARRLR